MPARGGLVTAVLVVALLLCARLALASHEAGEQGRKLHQTPAASGTVTGACGPLTAVVWLHPTSAQGGLLADSGILVHQSACCHRLQAPPWS